MPLTIAVPGVDGSPTTPSRLSWDSYWSPSASLVTQLPSTMEEQLTVLLVPTHVKVTIPLTGKSVLLDLVVTPTLLTVIDE